MIDSTCRLFRTLVHIAPHPRPLEHGRQVLSVGSCFSEHIARRLVQYRFTVCTNPTGILYNPVSISAMLRRVLSGKPYERSELFEHDGLYRSFDHHSDFAAVSPDECLGAINDSFSRAAACMQKLDTLIITLGTAFVYRLAANGRVVANCHTLPHEMFSRSLLSVREIVDECVDMLGKLSALKPGLNIILTVSPVRHLRDNAHENQVSKAHLMAAVNEIEHTLSNVYYFPAYEIMMDELRDYRFYDADMAHPSAAAADYIWQRFLETCVCERSREFVRRYKAVVKARAHRIRHASSGAVRRFASAQLYALKVLCTDFPDINLDDDREYFNALI